MEVIRRLLGVTRRPPVVEDIVVEVLVDEESDDDEGEATPQHQVELSVVEDPVQAVTSRCIDYDDDDGEEPHVMEVTVYDDQDDEAPQTAPQKSAKRRLFGSPRTAVGVQERMTRLVKRHSQCEAARLAALRKAQHDDMETATRLGNVAAIEEEEEDEEQNDDDAPPATATATKHKKNPFTAKTTTTRTSSTTTATPSKKPRRPSFFGGRRPSGKKRSKVAARRTSSSNELRDDDEKDEKDQSFFVKKANDNDTDKTNNAVFLSEYDEGRYEEGEEGGGGGGSRRKGGGGGVMRTEFRFSTEQFRDLDAAPTRTKVKSIVCKYEEMREAALRRAERGERDLRTVVDEDEARRDRRRRAADELRARQRAKERNAAAKPTFTNVSPSPSKLVLRATTETAHATISISLDGGKTWAPYVEDVVLTRGTTTTTKRKVVAMAVAEKRGMAKSDVASAVFSLSPPRYLRHSAFPRRTLLWDDDDQDQEGGESGKNKRERFTCSLCAATCDCAYVARDDVARDDVARDGGGQRNNEVLFALCPECALAPLEALAGRKRRVVRAEYDFVDAKEPSSVVAATPTTDEREDHASNEREDDVSSTTRPSVAVAVDAGAHRLWLSENVLFDGNEASVLPASNRLLEALASILTQHPSLCVRLEGHTNSACGVDCDGATPCRNGRCFATFGATGGALAFSKARADAVKRWLVDRGLETDRVATRGLAGSRRVEENTEGPTNYLNRRVEIHTLNFF